jgi:hypothetical protein
MGDQRIIPMNTLKCAINLSNNSIGEILAFYLRDVSCRGNSLANENILPTLPNLFAEARHCTTHSMFKESFASPGENV